MVPVIWLATAWQQTVLGTQESRFPCLPLPPPRYLLSPGLRRVECLYDLHLPSQPVTHILTDTQPQCWALDTAGFSLDSKAPRCVSPGVCRVGLGKVTGQGGEGPECCKETPIFVPVFLIRKSCSFRKEP